MPRLFRSSNKSQASLDRHTEAYDHSPIQPEPAYSQTQPLGGVQPPIQPPQQHQGHNDELYYTENQAQSIPAHILGRSQSSRLPSGSGDVYTHDQPIVNIVPPLSPVVQTHQNSHISGPIQYVQPQPVRVNQEPKKSKRSIFGLGGSKREEKDNLSDRRSVGRASSVLRKSSQQLQQQSPTSPQEPNHPQFSPGAQPGRSNPYHQDTTIEVPPGDTNESYEQFYRPQGQFDAPPPAAIGTRQTARYPEDAGSFEEAPLTPRHQQQPLSQAQRSVYQVYHQPGSASSSTQHLPPQHSQNYDLHQPLRPSSQTSLGPPSPLAVQQSDSRPPTSGTTSRYSVPALTQPQIQQDKVHQRQISQEQTEAMGRNENSNSNGRQHRDDERHAHYQSQQDPRVRAQGQEQGRSTPPPRSRDDLSNLDFAQLLQKHEELQQKYSKVKRYYFEREAQVTQLQNTVATQRLSLSKTTLDDAQYMQRFERMNGAIQNLCFNIRKDWRRIPNWLAPVCNRDAHAVGTKEMTAVGRACISRWLYESLFERVFHPGIDPNLSFNLKNIERNLRKSSYGNLLGQDDLITKITTWRLTTIEGLSDITNSRQSETNTENLTNILTRQLNDYMRYFLNDPLPPGLTETLNTIIIQALGIASNIPLESRDICIDYFMPASPVNETYMRLETGMTTLQAPGSASSAFDSFQDEDEMSTSSSLGDTQTISPQDLEAQIREASVKGTSINPSAAGSVASRNDSVSSSLTGKSQDVKSSLSSQPSTREKKTSFLGGFVPKKPAPATSPPITEVSSNAKMSTDIGGEYNLQSLTGGMTEGRIRFAAFLAIEVRGRSILPNSNETGVKESEKIGGNGDKTEATSAGAGTAQNEGAKGASTEKKGVNVLVKAPVYCFE